VGLWFTGTVLERGGMKVIYATNKQQGNKLGKLVIAWHHGRCPLLEDARHLRRFHEWSVTEFFLVSPEVSLASLPEDER
jgi:hypothetical protein